MVHLPDQQLISQSDLPVSDCGYVEWAPNETAASLVTDDRKLYVWPTNGSAPYFVTDVRGYICAVWSPDSSKVLTVHLLPDPWLATFQIVYPDGKPVRSTNAVIWAGNEWEGCSNITWLTNDVIRNRIACGGNYCLLDFYDANTGKFLIRNDSTGIGAFWPKDYLSPNERWLALDTGAIEDKWEDLYDDDGDDYSKRALVLYDLKNHRKAIWAETIEPDVKSEEEVFSYDSGHSYEFVAWNQDSSQFYYLHFPFDQPINDLPVGYLALDPVTLKSTLLIPNVVLARPSDDQQFIFAVTAEKINAHTAEGLQGAIYTVDGDQVTKPQWIADWVEFDMLNTLYSRYYLIPDLVWTYWDNRSEQVIFFDANNNLWVASKKGETKLVVSNLPGEIYFDWSPDGRFLFIELIDGAWIVKMR